MHTDKTDQPSSGSKGAKSYFSDALSYRPSDLHVFTTGQIRHYEQLLRTAPPEVTKWLDQFKPYSMAIVTITHLMPMTYMNQLLNIVDMYGSCKHLHEIIQHLIILSEGRIDDDQKQNIVKYLDELTDLFYWADQEIDRSLPRDHYIEPVLWIR